jgi:hypothetical protein
MSLYRIHASIDPNEVAMTKAKKPKTTQRDTWLEFHGEPLRFDKQR